MACPIHKDRTDRRPRHALSRILDDIDGPGGQIKCLGVAPNWLAAIRLRAKQKLISIQDNGKEAWTFVAVAWFPLPARQDFPSIDPQAEVGRRIRAAHAVGEGLLPAFADSDSTAIRELAVRATTCAHGGQTAIEARWQGGVGGPTALLVRIETNQCNGRMPIADKIRVGFRGRRHRQSDHGD